MMNIKEENIAESVSDLFDSKKNLKKVETKKSELQEQINSKEKEMKNLLIYSFQNLIPNKYVTWG